MKTPFGVLSIFLLIPSIVFAQQSIFGNSPSLNHQQVKLKGFDGFSTYPIDGVKADGQGVFNLAYNKADFGMAYISAEGEKAFIVILAPEENLVLKGETLASPQTVSIVSGRQNQLFEHYASDHPRREQALSA